MCEADGHGSISFHCLCCGSERRTAAMMDCPDYFLMTPARVSYFRCGSCGLVQQSPIPADTSGFYASYPIHGPKSSLYDRIRRAVLRPVYFNARTAAPGLCLLDYGCGDGSFLQWNAGLSLTRLGFEPEAAHAFRLASRLGVPVYSDPAKLRQEFSGRLDVVTMHFVLEHVTDLHGVFRDIAELLKPGGTLYCVVPQFDSWERRIFGRRWHALDAPRHISFPDAHVMGHLALAHGLELIRARAVPFPNGIAGSIPPAVFKKFIPAVFLLSMPVAIVLSRLMPTGFRAYWLRKTGH